jgi:hypothetical protein
MIALVAMFVVYRLEVCGTELRFKRDNLLKILNREINGPPLFEIAKQNKIPLKLRDIRILQTLDSQMLVGAIDELLNRLEIALNRTSNEETRQESSSHIENIKRYQKLAKRELAIERKIKERIKLPLILVGLVIAISIVFLPLSEAVETYGYCGPIFGMLLIGVLIFAIVTLYIVVSAVRNIISKDTD